jgi:hypothetical protein
MKTLVTFIAVIALTVPCFAGDATIDVASDGTVSLTFTGDAPVGIGLICDTTSGAANINGIANSAGIFNVNIDFAHTAETAVPGSYNIGDGHPAADPLAAGVATLPAQLVALSVGELDAADATSPVDIGVISMDAGDVCVSGDPLRGGIVDINGAAMNITNDGACFTVGPAGCTGCRGDISTDGVAPGTNGLVDFGDFNYFLGAFGASAPGFVITPVPADLLCADVSDDGVAPASNGQIDFGDFNYFLGVFGSYAPTFSGPCLP